MRFRIIWLALPVKHLEEDPYTGIAEMVTVMGQVDELKIALSGMNADLFESFALGRLKDGFAVL